MSRKAGTEATREFYDARGWHESAGKSVDTDLFATKEDGPIRIELTRLQRERLRSAISRAGDDLNVLECGCGGNPEPSLVDLCDHYTGVDFSETGLALAKTKLGKAGVPHRVAKADVCHLTFRDGEFDAVYCAHVLYHIEDPAAQAVAVDEICRVTRPGGIVVLIVANPRPLCFPIRMARRMIANTPVLGAVVDRFRSRPPLPYRTMPIGWFLKRLRRWGDVEYGTSGMPSVEFNQNVTEYKGIGKALWKSVKWATVHHPKLAAHLGNFVQFTLERGDAAPS